MVLSEPVAKSPQARAHNSSRAMSSRRSGNYRECVPTVSGPAASPVAAAAARTVAAGTARLVAAWSPGSSLPEVADRRSEGVADLAARRARVRQSLFFTDRATAALMQAGGDGRALGDLAEHSEMIYDGAVAYIRVAGSWTRFGQAEPGGPRGVTDPLWPLDALFGAHDDAAEIGQQVVRGVVATRYRLAIDLARADAALAAGVNVPSGPYRWLSRLPAEVWLDADGLACRISVNSEPAAAPDSQVWSVVELWDWGVAAEITPPGPGEVLAPAEAYRRAEQEHSGGNHGPSGVAG